MTSFVTKYIARLNGKIVGTRSSKIANKTYTHAIVANGHSYTDHVVAWSSSLRLAQVQQRNWQRYGYRIDIVPAEIIVPANRPDYNPVAVNQAIEASNRAGRRIGGQEARAIHALLQGRN